MKRNSLSVSMDAALKAWALRHPSDESTGAQIAQHAVAHGVSASGLRYALLNAGLIAKRPEKATNPIQPGS